MSYVYLLSDYDEYGAENVVATLDRAKLPALLAEHWGPPSADGCSEHLLAIHEKAFAKRVATLARLLEQPDEALAAGGDGGGGDGRGGHNLTKDWGGVQLHVVALE